MLTPPSKTTLNTLRSKDHSLNGGVLIGIDGYSIEIQARAIDIDAPPKPSKLQVSSGRKWSTVTKITGMVPSASQEALKRIEGAFAKLEIPHPQVSILINLAPAELTKSSASLDLPLAIIMLQAGGLLEEIPSLLKGNFFLMGELGIHGELRGVRGALPLSSVARQGQYLIVPAANEKECLFVRMLPDRDKCTVCPAETLGQVIDFLRGREKCENVLSRGGFKPERSVSKAIDFGRVIGQVQAKRAAVICAAGGHNLLLTGPPGEGKSLLASAIPGILPRLSSEESIELTKIYSACGKLERDGMVVDRRPFRAIHHGVTKPALVGGGSGVATPGEITLSHNGILFLDEIAEFQQATIESLRQPMESGEITISRVGATITYPCQFTMVAAMNPCPCGYYGTSSCTCSRTQVMAYQRKLSGPIVDRIDLQVHLSRLSTNERFAESQDGVSVKLRKIVEDARNRQLIRFKGKGIKCNASIPAGYIREFCDFEPDGFELYKTVIDENLLSTRSMDRLAKVSRTIADLGQCEQVEPRHVEEAKSFVVGGMLRDHRT